MDLLSNSFSVPFLLPCFDQPLALLLAAWLLVPLNIEEPNMFPEYQLLVTLSDSGISYLKAQQLTNMWILLYNKVATASNAT